jgi:uncharacterized protein (UPF0548 family)
MTLPAVHLRTAGDSTVEAALASAASAELTYRYVGATLDVARMMPLAPLPTVRRTSVDLGRAPDALERAVEGLRAWVCHRGIGATVTPSDAPVRAGTEVVVRLPLGPVMILAPCRIIGVVDEPNRFGFAYGTLPGHPEEGEESFVAHRAADGTITFTVSVAARPVPLLRLAGPAVLLAQRRALRGYLAAMAQHVTGV